MDLIQAYEAHHYSIAVLDQIETINSRMDQTHLRYPIAIEPGNVHTAWGVVVPDLPGCFSAADSGIDEAIDNAKESIELWIKDASDAGQDTPKPSSILALEHGDAKLATIFLSTQLLLPQTAVLALDDQTPVRE